MQVYTLIIFRPVCLKQMSVSKQAARTGAGRPARWAVRSLIKSRKWWSLGFINETGVENIELSGLRFFGEIVNPRLNKKVGVRKVTMVGWCGRCRVPTQKKVSVPEFGLERGRILTGEGHNYVLSILERDNR